MFEDIRDSLRCDLKSSRLGCLRREFLHNWARQLRMRLFVALLAGGLASASGDAMAQEHAPTGLELATSIEQSLIETIARCEKSVVAIWRVNPTSKGTSPSLPIPGADFVPLRYGTGVVIDPKGLILTQYQLLEDKDIIWITTSDRITREAKIRAADPRSGLAVLEIKADNLTPIDFGEAEKVKKGQIVVTLGNPHAITRDGQASASWGIVSNIGRKAGLVLSDANHTLDKPRWNRPTLHHYGTLIETDARLNIGSSGSVLVNLRGEMVGLTTAINSIPGNEPSASYAVPMNQEIKRIIDGLKDGREIEYGLLGVRLAPLRFDPKTPSLRGVSIREVIAGGPAGIAGLRKGDLVTHVNTIQMSDPDRMMLRLGHYLVGSEIRVDYLREGKKRSTDVILSKLAVRGRKIYSKKDTPWRGIQVDYATATPSVFELSKKGFLDPKGCVLIRNVDEKSGAWEKGLRPDMFISHVDGKRVKRPKDFREAVSSSKGPVRIRLTAMSGGSKERIVQPVAKKTNSS